jgi:hypothetical protein
VSICEHVVQEQAVELLAILRMIFQRKPPLLPLYSLPSFCLPPHQLPPSQTGAFAIAR